MFKVEAIGNLGADAVIKDANGSKFVAFRVANSYKVKNDDGTSVEVTDWLDCTMSNVESKVIPYLKRGVKVFVRGNGSLRCYHSPARRQMVAGCQVNVVEVELCGGVAEQVPRQLVDPETGTVHDTQKYYWCDAPVKGMKKDQVRELLDTRGGQYAMDYRGFVTPVPTEDAQQEGQTEAESQAQ